MSDTLQYICRCEIRGERFLLSSDGEKLTGLWFKNQKYYAQKVDMKTAIPSDLKIFDEAKVWLDIYLSGKKPDFTPPIRLTGTDFQNEVWQILCKVPYGKTISYGEISHIVAEKRNLKNMSAQAVGNAVSKNKILLIVPCHRVIGAGGNLVGYSAGLERKRRLLLLEKGCLA